MSRYHTTDQNNWQPRPRSGLSREYVHGPLQPMDEWHPPSPGRFIAGVAMGIGLFLLLIGIAAALPA